MPQMEEEQQGEVRDQLRLSGAGKTITTVEPKFIPKDAVAVSLERRAEGKGGSDRLCRFSGKGRRGKHGRGKGANGQNTLAAKGDSFSGSSQDWCGNEVIKEHSTIGLVITTDGSFGEIPKGKLYKSRGRNHHRAEKTGKAISGSFKFPVSLQRGNQKACPGYRTIFSGTGASSELSGTAEKGRCCQNPGAGLSMSFL